MRKNPADHLDSQQLRTVTLLAQTIAHGQASAALALYGIDPRATEFTLPQGAIDMAMSRARQAAMSIGYEIWAMTEAPYDTLKRAVWVRALEDSAAGETRSLLTQAAVRAAQR